MGAAMVAAAAVGSVSGPAEAARLWIDFEEAVKPRRERAALYARRVSKYEQLLAALAGFPYGKED